MYPSLSFSAPSLHYICPLSIYPPCKENLYSLSLSLSSISLSLPVRQNLSLLNMYIHVHVFYLSFFLPLPLFLFPHSLPNPSLSPPLSRHAIYHWELWRSLSLSRSVLPRFDMNIWIMVGRHASCWERCTSCISLEIRWWNKVATQHSSLQSGWITALQGHGKTEYTVHTQNVSTQHTLLVL